LDNPVNLTAADPGGLWSGTGITSAANGTFDPGTAGAGTFTITYTISGVCGDVATTNITVVNQVLATINAAGPFCQDAPAVNLTAVNPGGTWSGPGITNAGAGTFNPSVAGAGTHTITYITAGNCGDTSTINIVVNPLPVVNFVLDNASGCTPLTVTFTDNTNLPGSTVLWDFDGAGTSNTAGSVTNTFIAPGCYDISLTVTSAQGCSASVTNTNMVCVFAIPTADFVFGPQPTTVLQPEIFFTNLSVGASTYSWDFAGLGTSTAQHPTFVFPSDTAMTYPVCLDVVSANGCPNSICHDVIISEEFLIYVPNAFTPDGDGINDIFYPVITGYDLDNFTLMIFNRWGELIFNTELASKGWDGTHKAQKCKEDVYVWKIKAKEAASGDKRAFYGHVTLLR
jgi:gliding motility-associated-like protein